MIKDAIVRNGRRRSPRHNREAKISVFARDVGKSSVSAWNSISARTALGTVDVNVLYHSLSRPTDDRKKNEAVIEAR